MPGQRYYYRAYSGFGYSNEYFFTGACAIFISPLPHRHNAGAVGLPVARVPPLHALYICRLQRRGKVMIGCLSCSSTATWARTAVRQPCPALSKRLPRLASLSRTFTRARGMGGELAANPDDCVRVHMDRETSRLSSMWATLPMTFTTTVVWCVLVRNLVP